jgi:hypothetical protein
VDRRQLKLTAAIGTFWGLLLPFSTAGILAREKGTLKKAAFENSVKFVQEACVYNKKDKVHGIVDHIILGSEVQTGTGIVRLITPPSTLNPPPPGPTTEYELAPVLKQDIPYHPKPQSFYDQWFPKQPTQFRTNTSSATLVHEIPSSSLTAPSEPKRKRKLLLAEEDEGKQEEKETHKKIKNTLITVAPHKYRFQAFIYPTMTEQQQRDVGIMKTWTAIQVRKPTFSLLS